MEHASTLPTLLFTLLLGYAIREVQENQKDETETDTPEPGLQ
jgi:hypothetical protein